MTLDGTNRKVSFPSGSKFEVKSGGTMTIPNGTITSAMLANGAGVAALLSSGLGGSVKVTNADAATTTIVAANATKDRACFVLVVVDIDSC